MRFIRLLCAIASIAVISSIASAGTVSRLYDFEPGDVIRSSEVDAEFDNILSTLNGNINTVNILDGGVATADIGTAAVTDSKIASLPWATGNIATHAISKQKMAVVNVTEATNDTGDFSFAATSSAVTLTHVVITTLGRPVMIAFDGNGSGSGNWNLGAQDVSTIVSNDEFGVFLERNSATRDLVLIVGSGVGIPCSSLRWIDQPAAGEYIYTIKVRSNTTSGSDYIRNCKLKAWEL